MELTGKKIAVLAEDVYEDLELWYPVLRMREAGADVVVVGTGTKNTYESKHGYPVKVDIAADAVKPEDYAAVIVPGGYAPDKMRRYPTMLNLVRGIFERDGIVAMICHAGWVAVSAGILKGKTVTSTPAIKDDLINAGAKWVDREVVVDGNLISSRAPDDLPAFCRAIIENLRG